ncbi:SRPBCC family protein [Gordonia crocea]|uniref:SRPBCC family protein n=1 Tax=Gordonia crocea TaxID=589162 RepID=UPI00137B2CC3|nr:SRPBCC family protein [Gordonia crocea]
MRYRDQPTVEVEISVGAEPSAVWPVVTDIALPVGLPGELQRVEWLDGATEPVVGARFVGHNNIEGVGRTETICTVVEVEPERRWVYEVTTGDMVPWAQWGFEVDPSRTGSVVRQFARIGLAPSPLKAAIDAAPEKEGRIISRRLAGFRAAITANLDEVRRRCESSG